MVKPGKYEVICTTFLTSLCLHWDFISSMCGVQYEALKVEYGERAQAAPVDHR